jgi:hypothetical protein
MNTSISDILRDAGSSPVFWFRLAIILVLAIAGYFVPPWSGNGSISGWGGGKGRARLDTYGPI